MLALLPPTHRVVTGVCLTMPGREDLVLGSTDVTMARYRLKSSRPT
jgi:hypothetical protein